MKQTDTMEGKDTLEDLYCVDDFIYRLQKYEVDVHKKKYTASQIANLIAKAMLGFFEETETPY